MPRTNAIPPSILLAPTAVTNPAVPLADAPEAATRNVEVQTVRISTLQIPVIISLFLHI